MWNTEGYESLKDIAIRNMQIDEINDSENR